MHVANSSFICILARFICLGKPGFLVFAYLRHAYSQKSYDDDQLTYEL
jgi:hypothetical protein